MTGNIPAGGPTRLSGLTLKYPMSLGVFDRYDEAQRAVDELSDRQFPVENCMIVGTDLRQVERVTGRLSWGRVAGAGAASGVWLGLFVGLVLALFSASTDPLLTVLWCIAFGAAFGLVWGLMGYGFTRGARDFTSVSQVVATRYEVLTEHKFADQARTILADAGIVSGQRGGLSAAPATAQLPVEPPALPEQGVGPESVGPGQPGQSGQTDPTAER